MGVWGQMPDGTAIHIEKPILPKECLDAVRIVQEFMDQEEAHGGETFWEDRWGYGFSTDMGYLYEGLDGLEQYLLNRLNRGDSNEVQPCQ